MYQQRIKHNYKNIQKFKNSKKYKKYTILNLEKNTSVIFILIYLFAHLSNNLPENKIKI